MGALVKRRCFAFQNSSSLFSAYGISAIIALIKIEGLVTPLATILIEKYFFFKFHIHF
ncbi:hypothetical protein MNB_SM-5-955 [hydrothermal vent metagenome]|uniref:Uncharacterized protein n=1 Tax=hydrothermal vent metagenome TaxID=652676 RepID=A0A1W1BMK3_9ZZZZ